MHQAEHILENLPCGCIVFDRNGKITYANPAICEMLDYTSAELSGLSLELILTISSRIFAQTHLFPILTLEGKANEIFLNLKPKAGNAVPVMVNVKSSQENGLTSYVGTFATIWERQKYETELILAKKELEKAHRESAEFQKLEKEFESKHQQLDSNLSLLMQRTEEYLQIGKVLTHDMQEPIRKIAFSFQSLLEAERIKQDGDDLRKIDVINRSVSRLRNLTSALFDFVDLNSVKEVAIFLPIADLVREAEMEVRDLLHVADFKVLTGDMHDFFGRPTQIRRVFVELIKNSVENRDIERPLVIQVNSIAIKSNSYQVHTEKYNYVDHVQIEFSDNGLGFESRFESYVFGLSNKISKNSNEVGIGLTLCKQIISQHQGSIKAISKLGQGSKFTIVIPVNPV